MLVQKEVNSSGLETASDFRDECFVRPIVGQKWADVGMGDDLEIEAEK